MPRPLHYGEKSLPWMPCTSCCSIKRRYCSGESLQVAGLSWSWWCILHCRNENHHSSLPWQGNPLGTVEQGRVWPAIYADPLPSPRHTSRSAQHENETPQRLPLDHQAQGVAGPRLFRPRLPMRHANDGRDMLAANVGRPRLQGGVGADADSAVLAQREPRHFIIVIKHLLPRRHSAFFFFIPYALPDFAPKFPDSDAAADHDDPRRGIPLFHFEIVNRRVKAVCNTDVDIRRGVLTCYFC